MKRNSNFQQARFILYTIVINTILLYTDVNYLVLRKIIHLKIIILKRFLNSTFKHIISTYPCVIPEFSFSFTFKRRCLSSERYFGI